MCELFNRYENEIEDCCMANGLDFDKARKMVKCWNNEHIFLQYFDENNDGKMGLLDEEPMPVVLKIYISNNTLTFEKTENTDRYLLS
ncbi:MAG: hypothetical protein Q4D13_05460 [Erysipelotrichaceae bacterium]|nr:hypothetical protein [Erysipelotrichaceae bacterium]